MAQGIKGKFPVLLKVAFELRYRQGYTYLDRCGRTINLIQDYYPNWILSSNQVGPQAAPMFNVETGAKFSFSSLKLDGGIDRPSRDGDLEQSKVEAFADEVEQLGSIVADQLGVAEFSRIGCRIWHLFPAETREEAQQFLDSFGWYTVSPMLTAAFGGEQSAVSMAVTVDGADRKFRVGLETIERTAEVDLGDAVVNVPIHSLPSEQRQKALLQQQQTASRRRKHPPFAALIDVDAYRENPEAIKIAEFIKSSLLLTIAGIRAAAV